MPKLLRLVLVGVLLSGGLALQPRPALAGGPDGVVGDGTPESCTYTELNSEMGDPGLITFNCGPAPHTIILEAAGGMLPLAGQATTLDGGGLITLSGANVADRRLFHIGLTAALTLTHLTLSNATMTSYAGGALFNQGVLVLEDVVIHHAGAQGFWGGGAIYNTGRLTVRDSVLRENFSAGGGALYNDAFGIVTIANSAFLSNTVANGFYGGAITNLGQMTITGGSFAGNLQDQVPACPDEFENLCGGGAIANLAGANLVITGTAFSRNTSTETGGALLNKGRLSLAEATVNDNTATARAGGVGNAVTATAVLTRVVIGGNQTDGCCAGFYNYNSTASLTAVTLRDNTADSGGGGGLANVLGTVVVTDSTISGNWSGNSGGGISSSGPLTLTQVTISGNASLFASGGLLIHVGPARLSHVTISGNEATGSNAGGLFNTVAPSEQLDLTNVLLVNNRPQNCGGYALDSVTFSLATDGTCFTAVNGNQPSTAQLLGPLANNGGATLTQLPQPNSAALNNGTCLTGLNFDQRGLPRLVGASCDVGAVERQAVDFGWYLALPLVIR